jgi:Major tropism determinant N-terminal domain
MASKIQFRRDTSTNWTNTNPVLAQGEPGLETDTGKVKYGDGSSTWTSLSYASTLPTGMVPALWYGAPQLTNDLVANGDSNYMQFQTQTDWVNSNQYGRATLSWHDTNFSQYSHVQADPMGVSIRNAAWGGPNSFYANYWTFQNDGNVSLPQGGTQTSSSLGQGPDSDWVNPNNNTWSIRQYNGGFSGSYNGTDPLVWFDAANSPLGNSQFRGAIIEYHAFTGNGTTIGTIHIASDFNPDSSPIVHTEAFSGGNQTHISFWSNNGNNRGQIALTTDDSSTTNLLIQWTAKVFYGSELNC